MLKSRLEVEIFLTGVQWGLLMHQQAAQKAVVKLQDPSLQRIAQRLADLFSETNTILAEEAVKYAELLYPAVKIDEPVKKYDPDPYGMRQND